MKIETRYLSPEELKQLIIRERDFFRSVEELEIKVLIDTLLALYGPKDPGGPRPRRSRRLTISRPQRAIKRGQR